jgi:hypothetical protein
VNTILYYNICYMNLINLFIIATEDWGSLDQILGEFSLGLKFY